MGKKTYNMKTKLFIFTLALAFAAIAKAEELPLTVWVPVQKTLSESAKESLETKLSQMMVANNIGENIKNSRFIFTAKVEEEYNGMTISTPSVNACALKITFYIGDGIEGKAFSSYTTTVRGIGENADEARSAAIENISIREEDYKDFINEGKSKIAGFNNSNKDNIVEEIEKPDYKSVF
jgi:hypothetical protein